MIINGSFYVPSPPEDLVLIGIRECDAIDMIAASCSVVSACNFIIEDHQRVYSPFFPMECFSSHANSISIHFSSFTKRLKLDPEELGKRCLVPSRDWVLYERMVIALRILADMNKFSKLQVPAANDPDRGLWHATKRRWLVSSVVHIKLLFSAQASLLEANREEILCGVICWPSPKETSHIYQQLLEQ